MQPQHSRAEIAETRVRIIRLLGKIQGLPRYRNVDILTFSWVCEREHGIYGLIKYAQHKIELLSPLEITYMRAVYRGVDHGA